MRINIIDPGALSDQHLIAEYNEILMLLGYVSKYPKLNEIPQSYCLGKGHMKFFKDKLLYIKNRHDLIRIEMRKRGFRTNHCVELSGFDRGLLNNWTPADNDRKIIQKRIAEKVSAKADYYRYNGEHKSQEFLINLINNASLGESR